MSKIKNENSGLEQSFLCTVEGDELINLIKSNIEDIVKISKEVDVERFVKKLSSEEGRKMAITLIGTYQQLLRMT